MFGAFTAVLATIIRNKTKLLIITIAVLTAGVVMQNDALNEHVDFLNENDLLDKFRNQEL